jgi:hypothetical protein
MSDTVAVPLYGCLTGIVLPVDSFQVAAGISLRRGVFEVFSSPMLAFKEAPKGSHTPGPWVPVHGGFSYKARVELAIKGLSALDGISASQGAWLIAALLRLRVEAPVRIVVVADRPIATLAKGNAWARAFEGSPYHIGLFRGLHVDVDLYLLEWLAEALPVAARLFHEERFMRALTIFDESVWSGRVKLGTILLWTAVEILFDVSGEQHKTKAICSALAEDVGADAQDRDRAYNVIRDLYEKRGRIVHSGRKIDGKDFGQSYALARAAFMNVLGRKELPRARTPATH